MKTAIFAFIGCLTALSSIAQTKYTSVPAAVRKSFSKQYHGCFPPKKWLCTDDTYVAKFKKGKETRLAYYLPDGTWVKTTTGLRWTWNLPVCVKYGFDRSRFGPWRIENINFVESCDKNYYTISVFCEQGPEGSIPGDIVDRYTLYFNPDGTNFKTAHHG